MLGWQFGFTDSLFWSWSSIVLSLHLVEGAGSQGREFLCRDLCEWPTPGSIPAPAETLLIRRRDIGNNRLVVDERSHRAIHDWWLVSYNRIIFDLLIIHLTISGGFPMHLKFWVANCSGLRSTPGTASGSYQLISSITMLGGSWLSKTAEILWLLMKILESWASN